MTNDEIVQQKRFPFLACKFLGAFDNELFYRHDFQRILAKNCFLVPTFFIDKSLFMEQFSKKAKTAKRKLTQFKVDRESSHCA